MNRPLIHRRMTTLQSARRYEELLAENVAPSPYDYPTLFQADGWFAKQRAKVRFKLLAKLDPKLQLLLRPDERVYFVSTGMISNMIEQFFAGGMVAYYVNLRALVFTTERVLLIKITAKQKAGELVSELSYASLKAVKATWSGFFELQLTNGKSHRFSRVPKADRKFIRDFLSSVVGTGGSEARLAAKSDGLVHLCPHCFTGVPDWPLACGDCGGEIKSAKKAALLSLAFPGLGDLYLGHRTLALMELFGSGFLWFVFVITPLTSSESEVSPDAGYWVVAAIIIGITHAIDAAVTYAFARKGHHPGKPSRVVAAA